MVIIAHMSIYGNTHYYAFPEVEKERKVKQQRRRLNEPLDHDALREHERCYLDQMSIYRNK